MTMRSWRSSFSASRPLRPAALLLQLIDQIDQVEEAASGASTNDRRGDGDAQMGFTGAGATDEDRIALGVQECTGGEYRLVARQLRDTPPTSPARWVDGMRDVRVDYHQPLDDWER